ncbi:MAG: hypothetical protein LBR20_06170, partial [Propionibacteriaceae bacterium]|nr:hypothetical protein [Propionibacteriaceae bacterium]
MDSRRLRFVVATLVSVSLLGGLLASVPQFSSAATTLDGKKERVSVFGENGEDEFRSIVKASDGTLVAAGITTTNTIGDYGGSDGFVTKINQDAVGLWSTNIGGTSFDAFYSITEASDGGFVMAGGTTSLDFTGSLDPNRKSRDAAIAKIGPLNNQLWAQATGGGGDDFFNGVAACPDTGFIAVGWSDSLDGDIWDPINPDGGQDGIIVKYDKDGTKKWLRSTGGTNDDGLLSVAVAADGGFVVAGYTSSTNKDISTNSKSAPKGGQDGFIIRFDKWTNILWEANVGGSALDNLQTVAFTSDGGVVAVGVTYSTDGDAVKNKGGMDGLMIKLDKNGNKQWSRTFGGAG